jgi:hypothetical protein
MLPQPPGGSFDPTVLARTSYAWRAFGYALTAAVPATAPYRLHGDFATCGAASRVSATCQSREDRGVSVSLPSS